MVYINLSITKSPSTSSDKKWTLYVGFSNAIEGHLHNRTVGGGGTFVFGAKKVDVN